MFEDFINENEQEIQLVVFKICSEEYAFPVKLIQEIITLQAHTRIPKSPHFVEGVINLRGNIIPIINAKKKFLMDEACNDVDNKSKRIIIVETDEENIGVIVDSVSEVINLDRSLIEPPPIDSKSAGNFLWGVGKYQNRLIILLNTDKFLEINDEEFIKDFVQLKDVIKKSTEEDDVE